MPDRSRGGAVAAARGCAPDGRSSADARAAPTEGAGPSDAELVQRVVERDDRHAFAEIVRRHQSPVRTLLRRLTCGDAALADDLAQDAFLRAYRGLPCYRGEARLSSWLHRIAYNVFLKHHARAQSERQADSEWQHAPPAADPAPDRALLQHDLERAMAILSPPERAALMLAYCEGATGAEVASILGCPLGTAKSHILRGREKLGRRLGDWKERKP